MRKLKLKELSKITDLLRARSAPGPMAPDSHSSAHSTLLQNLSILGEDLWHTNTKSNLKNYLSSSPIILLEKLGPVKEKIYHGHKLSHDEGPNLYSNKLSTITWSLRVMLFN